MSDVASSEKPEPDFKALNDEALEARIDSASYRVARGVDGAADELAALQSERGARAARFDIATRAQRYSDDKAEREAARSQLLARKAKLAAIPQHSAATRAAVLEVNALTEKLAGAYEVLRDSYANLRRAGETFKGSSLDASDYQMMHDVGWLRMCRLLHLPVRGIEYDPSAPTLQQMAQDATSNIEGEIRRIAIAEGLVRR